MLPHSADGFCKSPAPAAIDLIVDTGSQLLQHKDGRAALEKMVAEL